MTDGGRDGADGGNWLRRADALQASRSRGWREKWIADGFRTGPADRRSAEQAIRIMYGAAGLAPPRIIWCGSPLALALTHSLSALPDALEAWHRYWAEQARSRFVAPPLRASIDESLRMSWGGPGWTRDGAIASVAEVVRDSVGQAMLRGLKRTVEPWVFHAVVGALDLRGTFRSIRHSIWQAVGEFLDGWFPFAGVPGDHAADPTHAGSAGVIPPRRLALERWFRHFAFGQHDADWLAVLDYFRDLDFHGWGARSDALAGLLALARSAGWALPRRRICWVSERPVLIQRDTAGRLHGANGPAIVYPDGWQACFWHGVPVHASWLASGKDLDPRVVLTWTRAEQRSALAEIAGGWLAVVTRLPTRIVDADADPSIGTLLECTSPPGGPRFLRVLCGTGRTFALPVPRECTTARQANAWTYGLSAAEYVPEVRT